MEAPRKRASAAAGVLLVFAAATVPGFAEEGDVARAAAFSSSQNQAVEPVSLAEQYLSRLAKKSRHNRNLAGGTTMGLGALGIAGGLAIASEEDVWSAWEGGSLALMGGVFVVTGGVALVLKSPAERAYDKIRPLDDPGQRQRACADALADLSKKGRKNRILGGAIMGAMAIGLAVASDEEDGGAALLSALIFGAPAVYLLAVKSLPEKTYQAYLEESRVKSSPGLILGFGPRGGFRVGLSLDF